MAASGGAGASQAESSAGVTGRVRFWFLHPATPFQRKLPRLIAVVKMP